MSDEHKLATFHFEQMAELSRAMESIPALVLAADYSYQSFGSWWLEFKKSGSRFRVVFDGRDHTLRIEGGGRVSGGQLPAWQILGEQSSDGSPFVAEVLKLIRQVSSKDDAA